MKGKLVNEFIQKKTVNNKDYMIKIMCFDEPVFKNDTMSCHTWVVASDPSDAVVISLALPNIVEENESEAVFNDIVKIIERNEAN